MKYVFAPWDLDMSWGFESDEIGENFERWLYFPVLDRMLSLDAGGIRQKAYDIWQQMRASIFTMEYLEAQIEEYTFLLGESGAMMRDAERWGHYMTYPDGYELVTFANMRWTQIDEAMEMIISSGETVDFLEKSHYEAKAGDIHEGMAAEYAEFYEAMNAEAEWYNGQDDGEEYWETEEADGEWDE